MLESIQESGMTFISDNAYRIENSQAYAKVGNNIRTVEFVRKKGSELLFVEAKTTFPNPNSPERFEEEINIICEKFIHSLNLFSSVVVGVTEDVLPDAIILSEKKSLVFVLIVKEHKTEWCRIIKNKLIQSLPPYLKKIWEPHVRVCNYDFAKKLDIVS